MIILIMTQLPVKLEKLFNLSLVIMENNNLIILNNDSNSVFKNINISNDMKAEVQILSKRDNTIFDDKANVVKQYYKK